MQIQVNKLSAASETVRLVRPNGEDISTTRDKLMRAGFGLRDVTLIATPTESYWQNTEDDVYRAAVACNTQAIGNYSKRKIHISATHPGQTFTFSSKAFAEGIRRRVASLIPGDDRCHYKATGGGLANGAAYGNEWVFLTPGDGVSAL